MPGCLASTLTSGGSRFISRCRADCASLKSSNGCIRSARVRSSPGVCGPRSSNSQNMAASRRSKLKASCRRCSYLVTRLSAALTERAREFSCSVRNASRTEIFVQVHDRVAIGFLVAGVDQGVEGKRIIIGSGDFFFQQRPEYPGFDFSLERYSQTSNHTGSAAHAQQHLTVQ